MNGLRILLALSVALTVVLTACGPAATPTVKEVPVTVMVTKIVAGTPVVESKVVTATPAKPKTIKLAFVFQYTGAEALSGLNLSDGAQLAIDQANEAGFIPGHKVEVVKLDNATATAGQMDPAQAAANSRKLAADPEVLAIIGPQSSTEVKAMLPILVQAPLAMVAAGPTNPDLTNPKFKEYRMADGKNVFFRTSANDSVIPPAMTRYAHEKLGANKVFLVDDGGAFGVGVTDVLQATAKDIGIEVVGRDRVDPQAADYGVLITKIKGVNPNAVFFSGGYLATGKFALQSKGRLSMVLMGTDNVAASAFIENATKEGAEGWYGTIGSPDITKIPEAQEFLKEYQARYARAPDAFAAMVYDATNAVLEVMRQLVAEGKPVTRESVLNGLREVKWTGITGPISFDTNGDVNVSQMSVWQIKNGKLEFLAAVK